MAVPPRDVGLAPRSIAQRRSICLLVAEPLARSAPPAGSSRPRAATPARRRRRPRRRPRPGGGQVHVFSRRSSRRPVRSRWIGVIAIRRLTTAWKSVPSIARPGRRRAADPEVGDPARVEPLDELVLVDPPAEPGDLDPSHSSIVAGRDVDVDQLAARQAVLEDVPGDDRRGHRGQGEVGMLVILLADRERRTAVDHRLHRRRHGARST